MFFLGIDLGQRRDNTAIAIVEKIETRTPWGTEFQSLHCRHAERVPLGTPYAIAVDATGVAAPVVEMMRRAGLGCDISAVTITGGGTASSVGDKHNVPKPDLWAGISAFNIGVGPKRADTYGPVLRYHHRL